jgi:hypothetical protein
MLSKLEVMQVAKQMDEFLEEYKYRYISKDSNPDLLYFRLHDLHQDMDVGFGSTIEIRDCNNTLLGKLYYSSKTLEVSRKNHRVYDTDYSFLYIGYRRVFYKNDVITYIKIIDRHTIVYFSLKEKQVRRIFRLPE